MFSFFKKKHSDVAGLKIPQHIAIIMDGNARWSKNRGMPTEIGHKAGADNLKKVAKNCIELGIKTLTVYAFSTENWQRPEKEVGYLMSLLDDYLDRESEELIKNNIKILISGNLEKIPTKTKQKICDIELKTSTNKALTLNVAFSYGSRQEIVDAAKKIAQGVKNNEIALEDIDENLFSKSLYRPEIKDPDLLIRTAGDQRLSNFLLWQSAYSELYFSKCFWPDFDKNELVKAIKDFNQRERRYGKR